MKKLIFTLIAILCILLISCKKEQEEGNNVDLQCTEQNDKDLNNSHVDLDQANDIKENNDNEFNKSNEDLQGDKIMISTELEKLLDNEKNTFEEMIEQANKDCEKQFGGHLSPQNCYGECNGALVFFKLGELLDFSEPRAVIGVNDVKIILGYIFECKYNFSFIVWKNGLFYTLNFDGSFQPLDENIKIDISDKLTIEFVEEMFNKHNEMFTLK